MSLTSRLPSSSRCPSPQRSYRNSSHDYVDLRRVVDLRNYHQLLDVFPRTGRVLIVGGFRVFLGGSVGLQGISSPDHVASLTTFLFGDL